VIDAFLQQVPRNSSENGWVWAFWNTPSAGWGSGAGLRRREPEQACDELSACPSESINAPDFVYFKKLNGLNFLYSIVFCCAAFEAFT
jgi:hypothetical protein